MFLYAKIVIDTLHMLSSLHEVRNYLEDLPSKLDEVYGHLCSRTLYYRRGAAMLTVSLLKQVSSSYSAYQ